MKKPMSKRETESTITNLNNALTLQINEKEKIKINEKIKAFKKLKKSEILELTLEEKDLLIFNILKVLCDDELKD